MKRRLFSSVLLPLGQVLRGNTTVKIPASVEASPVAFRDWEAAVGTRIAARARPMKLSRGVLTVRAASSTWAQELSLLADTITQQLRDRGVEVRSLRFRVGVVDAPERPPDRDEVRSAPPRVALPEEVSSELELVGDEALRQAIQIAASTNLGWQKTRLRGDVATKKRAKAKPPEDAPVAAPAIASEPARDEKPAEKQGKKRSDATSARPGARAPRSAASESARPARTSKPAPAGRRGKP